MHPPSLISAFAIHFLKIITCYLAKGEISIFQLVSVAEETGLKLALSETPKTGFLRQGPFYVQNVCLSKPVNEVEKYLTPIYGNNHT